ncbi:MAG: tetratricopeptide repeat protein [Hyphomonadaceae bacterium]
MKLLAAFAFVAALAAALPASAQWGRPFDQLQFLDSSAPSRDWRACTNDENRYSTEEIVAACSTVFETATDADTRAHALWWRAFVHERTGQTDRATSDYQAALAEFDQLIREHRSSIDAHFDRATLLISMREYDRALAGFMIADRMLGRQPRVRASIGRIAFLRGDYATAIAEFDLADRLARRSVSAGMVAHNRCEARAAAGVELDRARTICDRAVRDSQHHPSVLVSRGFLRFREGDMAGALEDFQRALDREPHNPGALYGRATVAARNGQQDAAAADLARARELSPRTVEYYSNAGMRP